MISLLTPKSVSSFLMLRKCTIILVMARRPLDTCFSSKSVVTTKRLSVDSMSEVIVICIAIVLYAPQSLIRSLTPLKRRGQV